MFLSRAGTRDEPLRTSSWETILDAAKTRMSMCAYAQRKECESPVDQW